MSPPRQSPGRCPRKPRIRTCVSQTGITRDTVRTFQIITNANNMFYSKLLGQQAASGLGIPDKDLELPLPVSNRTKPIQGHKQRSEDAIGKGNESCPREPSGTDSWKEGSVAHPPSMCTNDPVTCPFPPINWDKPLDLDQMGWGERGPTQTFLKGSDFSEASSEFTPFL